MIKMLVDLIHFGLSSVGCLLIDKGVFALICLPMAETAGRAPAIAVAIVVARLISGHCNFFYNQCCVFKRSWSPKSYWQYWGLVAVNVCLSMAITEVVTALLDVSGFAIVFVNFCADVILFVSSFSIQKFFIFKKVKNEI